VTDILSTRPGKDPFKADREKESIQLKVANICKVSKYDSGVFQLNEKNLHVHIIKDNDGEFGNLSQLSK